VPLQESKGDALQGQRVGWYASDDTAPVTAETLRAVESAARALADAGLAVQECRPPGIEQGLIFGSNCFPGLRWFNCVTSTRIMKKRAGICALAIGNC